MKTYKDDDSKLVSEIIKLLHGTLNIEKTIADKTMLELNHFLLKENYDLVHRFEYNNVEYGFIPNLSKITAGEFIDLDNYINQDERQLHKICSILYRPITKTFGKYYEIEDYEGTDKLADIMMKVDASIILGALVFFYSLSKSLLDHTNTYIQKELKKIS
jgi:hypothetical protein